jgi:hypothetical protein
MSRKDQGQIRILEAFLAILIVFSSFTLSANLISSRPELHHDELTSLGLQTLTKLDTDGSLDDCITSRNWTKLRETVDLALTTGIIYNLTVFDEAMQQVNDEVVSNGGLGGQEISSVEYVCASRNPVYRVYIIHLELAVAA